MAWKDKAKLLWENKDFFAKGKRGVVYKSVLDGKVFLLKSRNPCSNANNTVAGEAMFNKALNETGVGPKFYYYDKENDFLVREFVEGVPFNKWVENASKEELLDVLLEVLVQCRKMDLLGINKYEMTNPHKDIIVREAVPVLIDFERCRYTQRPKNVTQFCQFLSKGRMKDVLSRHNVSLDALNDLANNYKKDYDKEKFDKIKIFLRESF